jgi:hypothetical protein
MSKVVFYTDKPGCEHPTRDVQEAVLSHFKTNVAYWCHATETAGFESGVDWDALVREGAVAVVLYDVNDACAYGLSLEAQNAGLDAYELNTDKGGYVELLSLDNVAVAGKHFVRIIRGYQS